MLYQKQLKGTEMDHQKLLEAEMSKMAHTFALQMVGVRKALTLYYGFRNDTVKT